MEFFVRGLRPPGLKQTAHQFLIENPPETSQQLKDHIATKDISFAKSSEFTGTASSSVDNKLEIEGIKDQLKELTGLMKDHKINAAYNPNEPRNKQNHTRFCKCCRRSGHTISVCFKYRYHKDQNRKPPQYREKFSDNYNRRSRPREENSYNNRYNSYNQRNNNTRPYSPYPRQFNNKQTFSIDLDLKVLYQEIEISITDLMINITQIVRIRTTQLQITIINIGTEAILYPIEIKDHFHKTIIERDTKTDLTKTNSHPTITKQDLQVIQNHPPEKIEETETLKFNLVRTK